MKTKVTAMTLATLALASVADAREPGTPTAMPPGGTIGVPIGANPPPGFYYTNRNEFFSGNVFNGSTETPVEVNVQSSAHQLHWVSTDTILGASYRAMLSVPFVWGQQDAFGSETDDFGLGDITVSPLNLSWMIAPGLFVHTGLSVSLPTAEFSAAPGTINFGSNAVTTAADVAMSYVGDGWNLTAHANYFIHSENPDTSYRSGDEIMVNWTAMKDIGGFSIGPVGYFRQQLTDDKNSGPFYGGTISGKAKQYAIGFGVTKTFGKVELNASYLHDFKVENALGGNKVMVNLTMPINF